MIWEKVSSGRIGPIHALGCRIYQHGWARILYGYPFIRLMFSVYLSGEKTREKGVVNRFFYRGIMSIGQK